MHNDIFKSIIYTYFFQFTGMQWCHFYTCTMRLNCYWTKLLFMALHGRGMIPGESRNPGMYIFSTIIWIYIYIDMSLVKNIEKTSKYRKKASSLSVALIVNQQRVYVVVCLHCYLIKRTAGLSIMRVHTSTVCITQMIANANRLKYCKSVKREYISSA